MLLQFSFVYAIPLKISILRLYNVLYDKIYVKVKLKLHLIDVKGFGKMKKIDFNEHKNVVGASVKRLRCAAGMSQEVLAAKMQVLGVHMDQQMISRIEKNLRIVTDYEFACFCEIFDVSPQALLEDFQKLLEQ